MRSQQNLSENRAVGVCQTFLTAAGRPGRSTANGHISDSWGTSVDRPGRPKQTESTVKCPVDPSGRPTCTHAQRAHRSTRTVDRLLSDLKNQTLQKPEPRVLGLVFWVEVLDLIKIGV